MGEVRVRRLDDAVIVLLKDRAARLGTSVEAILRSVITEEALRPKREMVERLLEHQRRMLDTCGVLPDSTPGIRQERDRLG